MVNIDKIVEAVKVTPHVALILAELTTKRSYEFVKSTSKKENENDIFSFITRTLKKAANSIIRIKDKEWGSDLLVNNAKLSTSNSSQQITTKRSFIWHHYQTINQTDIWKSKPR